MELNKLEESLFILFRAIANIEASKKLYEYIGKAKDIDKKRQGNYQFIAINNLYLFTNHFIQEEKLFCGLKNEFEKVKEYLDFKKEKKIFLSKLNEAKDRILKYRNTLIGHYYRDNNNDFIHFSDLPANIPSTSIEIFYYSDFCNSLFVVIAKIFESELKNVIQKMNDLGEKLKPKELDIEQMDKDLEEFKKLIKDEYGDIEI